MKLTSLMDEFLVRMITSFAALADAFVNTAARFLEKLDNTPTLFIKECDMKMHYRWEKCRCERPEPKRVGFLFHQQQQQDEPGMSNAPNDTAHALRALAMACRMTGATLNAQPKSSQPKYPEFFINH